MLDYNYSNYTYHQDRFNERLSYPDEVLGRIYHVFRASYIMDISQTKLAQLKFFFGPSLRVGQGDFIHGRYAYSDNGVPFESHDFLKV